MNDWERMVVEKGKDRLLLFCRYVDDCLGIWKVSRRTLDIFIKELSDNGKGVFLQSESEENEVLNFLDIRFEKKKNGRFVISWFQKKCAARVFCHKRSDVDEITKENFIRNMEERIEKINTEEDQKKRDVERFWEQLNENGYMEDGRRMIRRRKWHKRKE